MIERILKAKHWQLFLLSFGVPMIFQIAMMITMFTKIGNGDNQDASFIFDYMIFIPIILILAVATQFGWFWSVAIGLQNKIPANVTMKIKKFKIFFFIPLSYIILISIFIGFGASQLGQIDETPNAGLILSIFAMIIPLHLFSMFCIFYSLYFVAKTYKTVELQREVSFSEFAGEFFLIWFYPIGIWIIQPKVNKLIENQSTAANSR